MQNSSNFLRNFATFSFKMLENSREFSKILENIWKIANKKVFGRILVRISIIFDDSYRPGPLQTFPDLSKPSQSFPILLIVLEFNEIR